ncbi:NUDIX hydrolase [Nanchangia anserum]|uniref:NUDIX hydrolase n=1 Tax=Nanchangia anserum TaxID=2692125 RepID=A0A8I0KVZ1_9ACTO|nr:NUDIX domain-containing protein [Nanchangia anserum]MBD3689454.1 NUDIX hydrolase [Nanchangia anserum]QOX81653.1 NUDIX hydrolase [Nanchangia anserum]
MPGPRPTPPPSRVVRAGGAVVWRIAEGTDADPSALTHKSIEVLIVHRPKYGDWSWPKGKQEPGEHIVACATREVEEETGVPVRLGPRLTMQRYKLGRNTTKEVHYWIATPDLAQAPLLARAPAERAPEREIDRVRWVKPAKAMRLLTRRGDRRLLSELLTRLDAGRLATRSLLVLRHAKAIKRSEWADQPESQRPLARRGVYQVGRVSAVLSAYGVDHLVTSPWRRCLATLAPYATLTGAPMDMAPELTEDEAKNDPAALRAAYRGLITPEGANTVVCVHRPTIPALVGELAPYTPNRLSRLLPQGDPLLHTAEALVVHLARYADDADPRDRVVDLETVRV